jgi:hypothetical protein
VYRAVRRSVDSAVHALRGRGNSSLQNTLAAGSAMFAEKTNNTAHPDYEPELARCFSDSIHNPDCPCNNPLFLEIRKMAKRHKVSKHAWQQVYRDVMEEASTVPGFDQMMERKAYIENYLAGLGQRYQSHFVAGWVNLVDAQFLYWLVRHVKPKTIVETGVSIGLSSAFIMLALTKNGESVAPKFTGCEPVVSATFSSI